MSIGLYRGDVLLQDHQDKWEENAKDTIAVLKDILGDSAIDIEHIGSTAIKSICAKPIIDIVIGVNDLDDILKFNTILEEKGFLYRGNDHPGQCLYVCGRDDFITHHIHVCKYNSDIWNDYINIRDYLNNNYDDALEYEKLKKYLANKYPKERKTYTSMKADLINEIIDKARKWKEER